MLANPDPAEFPPLRSRRWRRRLLGGVLLVAVPVVLAPSLAGLAPVRAFAVGRINARLAPGSVAIEGWSLGWLDPIRVRGLTLIDPKGKRVVEAAEARTSWGLLGLILARPDLGTITVEGARVDVERRVDGTIDVLDALAAVSRPDPQHPTDPDGDTQSLRVVVQSGTLRATSPELAEPLVAGEVAGTLAIVPRKPITLMATLTDREHSVRLDAVVERPAPHVPDDVQT